jgi:hypothetical protein
MPGGGRGGPLQSRKLPAGEHRFPAARPLFAFKNLYGHSEGTFRALGSQTKSEPVHPYHKAGELKAWNKALGDLLAAAGGSAMVNADPGRDRLSRDDLAHKIRKVRSCGSLLEFRERGAGPLRLHNGQFCKQTAVCPICAARAQARRRARFEDAIKAQVRGCVREAAGRFNYAYMLTLTVAPRQTFEESADHVKGSDRRFMRMGQRRAKGKRSRGEWGKVLAGLGKQEFKRGLGSGLPHVHIHKLVFTDRPLNYRVYDPNEKRAARLMGWEPAPLDLLEMVDDAGNVKAIPCSKLSREWYEATGDSVNIKVNDLYKYWMQNDRGRGLSYEDSVLRQSKEILKYVSKWNSLPDLDQEGFNPSDFVDVMRATYCRRTFATYGAFRKVGGSDWVGSSEEGDGEKDDYFIDLARARPEIYSTRWSASGYGPLVQTEVPVFEDSDPCPWLQLYHKEDGTAGIREHPRRAYKIEVSRVNGSFRSRRFAILRLRDAKARRYDAGRATEKLFRRLAEGMRQALGATRDNYIEKITSPPPTPEARRLTEEIDYRHNPQNPRRKWEAEVLQRRNGPDYMDELVRHFMEVLDPDATPVPF